MAASIPSPARARSIRPWIMGVSLALNLALVVLLAGRLGTRPAPATVLPTRELRLAATQTDTTTTPDPSDPEIVVTNVLAFHWRQLEATDYPAYMAKLRAVGCPEETVRDIILADLEALYRDKRDDLQVETNFWATGNVRRVAERERRRQEFALKEEQRAAVKQLLGIEWWRPRESNGLDILIGDIFGGIFSPERRETGMGLLQAYRDRADFIHDDAGGLLLPADKEALLRLHDEFWREASVRFNPAEIEELHLRALLPDDAPFDLEHLAGIEFTGAEFREVVRRVTAHTDYFAELAARWLHLSEMEPPKPDAEQQQEIEASLREFLGPEKVAAWQRATDEEFQKLFRLAEEHDLGADAAARAFELRRLMDTEARGLLAENPDLKTVEHRMGVLYENLSEALTRELGSEVAREFLGSDEAWIGRLVKQEAKP